MSIAVMSTVWKKSQHKGNALLTLLAIADLARDDGYAWPSIDTIRNKTRLSERQTLRIIKILEDSGELKVDHRRNLGNVYRVLTDNLSLSKSDNVPESQLLTDSTMSDDPLSTLSTLSTLGSKQMSVINKYLAADIQPAKFLSTIPELTRPLATVFVFRHERIPIKSEESYWRKGWNDQARIGITDGDLWNAYDHLEKDGMTINSPKSLTAVAERFKKDRGKLSDTLSDEVVKMGDIEYIKPKSRTVVP